MSVSKAYTNDPKNVEAVLGLYLSDEKPVVREVAQRLGTTAHNVQYILRTSLDPERLRAEQALRYSRSKMGERNPMQGRSGSLHHNYVGVIPDGHGYLQVKVSGKYVLLHRKVMADALGVERLPDWLDVHHIDENKHNNDLDNLALVTRSGHRRLHARRSDFEKLPLWAQWESGTSKSRGTIPT